jgi:hypothetical protein
MAGASRFLTGRVTCLARLDGIPAVRTRRVAPEGLYRGGPVLAAVLPWLTDFGDTPSF